MNHTGLFFLPSLFYYTPDKEIKYCWNNKYKNRSNQTLFEPTDKKTKFMFGIRVWKSKFDEKMSKTTNFSSKNSDELNKENNKIVECDEYLNVHSLNLYTDTVSILLQKAVDDGSGNKESTELAGNLIKWDIRVGDGQIKLEVFKKINTKWESINIRIENYYYPYKYGSDFCNNYKLIESLLFSNDDIVILTTFEHKLELIDDIYKKCTTYSKEDLMNNKSFLSIITSAMPLLNEYYPEYILKYSSETNMIIDSSFYYYNWFLELIKPQPSPFTETINRNIYKTWNGEALINFKWNAYGKYYYAIIWILFMTLLGCFTTAATIPQQYINKEVRQQLFIASIILGSIHLIFEIRQFCYNITKWFYNFWNIFGKYDV
ncbi:hypothetical protein RhiirB3_448054 [Rhizophagus irregularis]|nr:hypothetical protein RhiirB3_448054 [Rhizophagus irregularis]